MNRMRKLFSLLICCLLCACAATNVPQSRETQPQARAEKALSFPQLRRELAALPGVTVADGEPLRASYPAGTLFAAAAVLPMPGGTVQLDALAALLKKSNMKWNLRVRAATADGRDYDGRLAADRARILGIYLREAGVDPQKINLTAVAEEGAPLELTLRNQVTRN